ncbi:hypothetical protein WN990_35105 [Kitasatospora purpeofusca]|uniref:hypothetical protein n=1 Tax=Kitasatospora purpeofusca TaxID=67352 RepID=UPI0030F00CD9
MRRRVWWTVAGVGTAAGSGTPTADSGGGALAVAAGGGDAVGDGAVREVRVRVERGVVGADGHIHGIDLNGNRP